MEKLSRRSFLKGAAGVAASASSLGAVDFVGFDAMPKTDKSLISASHFGAYHPVIRSEKAEGFETFKGDVKPTSLMNGVIHRVYAQDRIKNPSVRKSVLEKGFAKAPKNLRGKEEFVEISWEKAYELVANELKRVYKEYGSNAIYGGSYGWFCVGSVNNPQSLLGRMLNIAGGCTTRTLTYSTHCIRAITPYISGVDESSAKQTSWDNVLEHSKVIVLWSNDMINTNQIAWGVPLHESYEYLEKLQALVKANKIKVINIDPVYNDTARYLGAEQVFINPTTDVAMVEAMCYHLIKNNLHNEKFLKKYTVGFAKLKERLFDEKNPKTPEWAEKITGVSATKIKELAELMAKNRTMIMAGWGFQRAHHGEQTHWAMITLASVLGQIGLDGGGYGFSYHYSDGGVPTPGAVTGNANSGNIEDKANNFSGFPGLAGISTKTSVKGEWSDRENEVIPVSRIVDMLENPNKEYIFDGKVKTFPLIKSIYWAGGNPMHHHQDRNRQLKAFAKVDSFIVQDCFWTASARHADLVLPATTEIERNDITKAHTNKYIFAMKECVKPMYNSKNDYDIFCGIIKHFGEEKYQAFTEGRSADEWIKYFYEQSRTKAAASGLNMPSFEDFWAKGYVEFKAPEEAKNFVKMKDFRDDPITNRLGTPSGKIEIFSKKIEKYNLDDCQGLVQFYEPAEYLGNAKKYKLNMVTPHPKYRLHSQLNNTIVRDFEEVDGKEALWMNPADAKARGIKNGDIVRIYNDRGEILGGVLVTPYVKPGVIRMQEGSWYNPDKKGLCLHGDVNVLIADIPSSKLACGNQATALVEVEKYTKDIPALDLFRQPKFKA